MIARLDKWLQALERATTFVALILMLAIMLIIVADVFMRYVMNRPFPWAYDLVSMYLMGGLFFFVLSDAYRTHSHVSVDILQLKMSPTMLRASELVTAVLGLVVFALLFYAGAQRAWESYVNRDVVAGAIHWPTWVSDILVPIGAGMITLRLALHVVVRALSLFTSRDALPLRSASATMVEEDCQ